MIKATTKSIGRRINWYAKTGMSRVRSGIITGITPELDVVVEFNDTEFTETHKPEALNWLSGDDNSDLGKDMFKKEVVFTVDYNDLEYYLESQFGYPPECLACWEQGNDTTKEMNIDGDCSDWDDGELEKFKKDGKASSWGLPELLMNDLCRRNIVEKGTYMVNVCW